MRAISLVLAGLLWSIAASADELLTVGSPRSVTETLDRLQALVTGESFTIVARVRHSESATRIGIPLRPTELLIFGRAQNGTPMMVCDQRAGIDLPFRALAWEDAGGKVWLGMLNPAAFRTRWGLDAGCDPIVEAMAANVQRFLAGATAP